MFFLIAFAWHVAASFAFVIAILSPNWLYINTYSTYSGNITIERGIFYVCDLLSTTNPYVTTGCASIIKLDPSTNLSGRWNYSKQLLNYFILCYE